MQNGPSDWIARPWRSGIRWQTTSHIDSIISQNRFMGNTAGAGGGIRRVSGRVWCWG